MKRSSGSGPARWLAAAAVVVLLGGCGAKEAAKGKGGGAGGRKFPVETEPVALREIRPKVSAVGSLEASSIVEVTARVGGVAEKVTFREGERATPDRVLVEIEPERYRLAAAQARANLARTEAAADLAASALARREQLREKDAGWVSAEEIATARSRLDVARAEVAQAKAALDLAELNVQDALVRAGTSGILEKRLVQPGQYVAAGTTLATLVEAWPLYLRFKVTEREAILLRPGLPAGLSLRSDGERTATTARIVHVGESADPKSRMVECLARVDGRDPRLRPGSFAEVTVVTGSSRRVPVIPEGAIKPTEKGFVVFVVKDGKAEERVVEPGFRSEDGGMEIRAGLAAGEELVTRGAQYLRHGVAVEVSRQ